MIIKNQYSIKYLDLDRKTMRILMQRLPLDINTFSELRAFNYLYVDKTKYLYNIITGGRRFFYLDRVDLVNLS